MEIENTIDEFTQKRLDEETAEIQKEHEKKIKFFQKNSGIYGGVGLVLFIAILAAYVIPQFFRLQDVRAEINTLSLSIEDLADQKKETLHILQTVDAKRIVVEKKLGHIIPKVLPEVHSASAYQKKINFLATFFEDFALENNNDGSSIDIPSIDFGKAREEDDIFVVPIQMTVEAGESNFYRFLEQIDEKSGSIDPNDFYSSSYTKEKEPVPVMSIDALSLVFPKEETAVSKLFSSSTQKKKKTYTFTVSISAYFQATEEMKEMFGSKKRRK